MIAVVSALEGNLDNFREGIISDETLIERAKKLIAELKEIIPHTVGVPWIGPSPDVVLPRPAKTGFEESEGPPTSEWPLRPRHESKP